MGQLEDLLHQLLAVSRERYEEAADCEAIVNKLMAHHKEYNMFKWAMADEDVLPFYSPVWLGSFEKAHIWITGWKPSTVFRLVKSMRKAEQPAGASVAAGMTEEQVKQIKALREEIKVEEERGEREMERQQVAIADRKMVELARLGSVAKKNGDAVALSQVTGLVEAALKGLAAGLEKVMKMADCVRIKALKGVLDVLTPIQGVDFLTATSILQIQIRKWGEKRDKRSIDDQNFCFTKSESY